MTAPTAPAATSAAPRLADDVAALLRAGAVIPAQPLALDADRRLDERRQRALTRYYHAAGAGGVAVGVHTTQFEIREHGLLRPVLELAAEVSRATAAGDAPAGLAAHRAPPARPGRRRGRRRAAGRRGGGARGVARL